VSDRFFVYILASANSPRPVLYTGVTNDLERRLAEHRLTPSGFTGRYGVTKLVYFEWTASAREAIAREKRIKGWSRARKVALIERANPEWRELAPGGGGRAPTWILRGASRRSERRERGPSDEGGRTTSEAERRRGPDDEWGRTARGVERRVGPNDEGVTG
jgi:putative endonuclease